MKKYTNPDTNATAKCVDCDWAMNFGTATLLRAKEHAKDHKHDVVTEKFTKMTYLGSKE